MDWDLLPTEDPKEEVLRIWVDKGTVLSLQGQYIDGVTALAEFNLSSSLEEGLGAYVYTMKTGPNERGELGFHFAKNKTDTQKNTPFHTSWKKFGNHRWCPILKGLAFVQDYNFPSSANIIQDGVQGVATSPRNYLREAYIEEVNEGSRFLLDEFQSPTPYAIGPYPVPQPGRISYQLNGLSGSIPDVLHDDMTIPASNSATATLVDGSEASVSSMIVGQFFPRTNFRRRRPYILAADQELRGGVWYMQRLRVFPPRQPKTTFAAG